VAARIRVQAARAFSRDLQPPLLDDLGPVAKAAVEVGLVTESRLSRRARRSSDLAVCIRDPRAPEHIVHGLEEIVRFRILMIAAGSEDGNDADSLRADPLFKLAMDQLPEHDARDRAAGL
jgi:hypothetical protein